MNQLEKSERFRNGLREYFDSNLRTYYYAENNGAYINWFAVIAVILFLILIFK